MKSADYTIEEANLRVAGDESGSLVLSFASEASVANTELNIQATTTTNDSSRMPSYDVDTSTNESVMDVQSAENRPK